MLYQGFRSFTHKLVAYLTVFVLVFSTFFTNGFFITNNIKEARAEDLCQVPVDVILVMDISGSMADGATLSLCNWEELEWVGPSMKCVGHSQTGLTETQCLAKPDPVQCGSPIYTPASQSKITSAKSAANSFLNNLGASDQSALVSFADTAILKKSLSADHAAAQSAVNSLTTGGSTNIGDAIQFATEQLNANGNDQAVRAMILLTDGKANQPSTVPDPELYAEEKANEAGALGYKIFTIGLGSNSDINETMLQTIANNTGAAYYHAVNGNDLSDIYNSIAYQVCQYASISGCKWHDANADSNWQDTENELLEAWEIQLLDEAQNIQTQPTDQWGCYQFSGLTPGNYQVREVEQPGWVQTYPTAPNYHAITITGTEKVENIHFGNYQPQCGNSIIDSNFGEVCEIGNSQSCTTGEDYSGTRSCDSTCASWGACVTPEMCGDGIKNGNEECDGADGLPNEHYSCTTSCTLEYAPYCGDGLINQAMESCDGDADRACEFGGYTGTQSCNQCGWGNCQTTDSCGDGVKNGPELCDSANQACATAENYNGTQACNSGCDGWNTCQSNESCGDGIKNGNEECDDGNLIDGDSCSATCQLEQNQPAPICGNNIIESGEQCDDGNTTNGDSCSSICETETSGPVCGDNNLDQGEQCDDGNTTDGDGCNSTCQTEQPAGIQPGDIVINEIMQDPASVPDVIPGGEWFEVYNITNHNIDLNSCVITDGLFNNYHTISSPLIVLAHNYAVLGNNGNKTNNGGVDIDYQYSTFGLANNSDEIVLYCEGVEIDRVEYTGVLPWPHPTGKSMVLAHPGLDNNIGSNWCVSSSIFGVGDLGTPGAQNDPCAGFTCNYTAWQDNECVSDGQRQQSRQDDSGLPFCLELTQNIPDPSCACVYTDWTAGECVSNTSRIESRAANFAYCTGTSRAVEDATCAGTFPTFGSIAVYKYLDFDGNLQTSLDQALSTSTIWTFFAEYNQTSYSTTTALGIANFRNLPTGDYAVSEQSQDGWYLLGTDTATTTVSVLDNATSTISFFNAPSAIISGYKFEDLDHSTTTVADLMGRPGWVINLFSATSTSTPVATTTTDSTGYFEFKNLLPGSYSLTETLKTGWQQLSAPPESITVSAGEHSGSNNFINYYTGGSGGEDLFCGDNIKNNQEQCDGTDGITDGYHCAQTCILEVNAAATTGGGYNYQDLIIMNEAVSNVVSDSATISWLTNKFATSRVIYDTVSHLDINGSLPPNYNYLYSTLETDASQMVTGHAITLTNLLPGTAYYVRPISHASPEKYGQEISFTTTGTNTTEFDQSGTGGVGGEEPSETGNNAAEADGKSGGATATGSITLRAVSDTGNGNTNEPSGETAGEQTDDQTADLAKDAEDNLKADTNANQAAKVLGASTCKISWWLIVIIILIYLSVIYRYYRYWQQKKFKYWYVFPIIFTIAAALFVLAVFKCWL